MSITPSATTLLTRDAIRRLKAVGLTSVAFSLDGSTPARHDGIRGVGGTFERTVSAIRWALELGLPVQVNTLVSAETAPDLGATYAVVRDLGIRTWALFFLVGVGRGAALREVSPDESERILVWLHGLSHDEGPVIRTTEAHHYRRVALQEAGDAKRDATAHTSPVRQAWGIRDGAGIMFISHRGDIYPSGFLPLAAGNVRKDDLVETYRSAPVFRQLRDPRRLKGKCGRCEFRVLCGGSRARAYARTGDPLESDPLCPYQPVRAPS